MTLLKINRDDLCDIDGSKGSILIMFEQSATFDTVSQDYTDPSDGVRI